MSETEGNLKKGGVQQTLTLPVHATSLDFAPTCHHFTSVARPIIMTGLVGSERVRRHSHHRD
jgi:hypothetical protein